MTCCADIQNFIQYKKNEETYTMKHINIFFIRVFFHGHWRLTGQQGKGGNHFLFHSTTFTCLRTFRGLFATLHVRWLSYVFNCTACIYQSATWWDFTTLSNYHLIDWWCEVCFCFCTWWFDTRFLLQQSWYGKSVDSELHQLYPCITSKATNQMC